MDDPEEAKESGGDKAGAGDGSESDKAGNESDVTVEVESEPVLKAKSKCKASESVRWPRVVRIVPSARRLPQASLLQRWR